MGRLAIALVGQGRNAIAGRAVAQEPGAGHSLHSFVAGAQDAVEIGRALGAPREGGMVRGKLIGTASWEDLLLTKPLLNAHTSKWLYS